MSVSVVVIPTEDLDNGSFASIPLPNFPALSTEFHMGALILSLLAIASQTLVIIISRGLDSKSPAATLMLVQACAEIWKRSQLLLAVLCTLFGESFCAYKKNYLSCLLFIYTAIPCVLVPDYIAALVSIDRVLSFSIWYRSNWTKRNVWIIIAAIFAIIFISCSPRAIWVSHSATPNGQKCWSGIPGFDKVMFFMGIPAVAVVTILTVILISKIRERKRKSSNVNVRENSVTLILTINCFIFAVFSILQYIFAVIASTTGDTSRRVFLFGISNSIGSFGVLLRGPIYLGMKPMRQAFSRASTVSQKRTR